MALKDLFRMSSSAIREKLSELEQKRSNKQKEQAEITEHLASMEAELKKANLEFQLEDSSSAAKRAEELRSRIAKVKPQLDRVEEEVRSISEAQTALQQKLGPSQQREVRAVFEDKCKSLSALGGEIETLLSALSKKVAQGAELASECQQVSLPHTHGSHAQAAQCNDAFRDAFLAGLMLHFEDSVPYIRSLGLTHAKQTMASNGGFGSYLESRLRSELRRLDFALTGSPNQTVANELPSESEVGAEDVASA